MRFKAKRDTTGKPVLVVEAKTKESLVTESESK